jgi:hypothetical protein
MGDSPGFAQVARGRSPIPDLRSPVAIPVAGPVAGLGRCRLALSRLGVDWLGNSCRDGHRGPSLTVISARAADECSARAPMSIEARSANASRCCSALEVGRRIALCRAAADSARARALARLSGAFPQHAGSAGQPGRRSGRRPGRESGCGSSKAHFCAQNRCNGSPRLTKINGQISGNSSPFHMLPISMDESRLCFPGRCGTNSK